MSKKLIRITIEADLEVSEDLFNRLRDEDELYDFVSKSCFRNNDRRILEVEIDLLTGTDFYPITKAKEDE